MIEFNENHVIEDFSDNESSTELIDESRMRNISKQISHFENKIASYIIRGSSLDANDQLLKLQNILDKENQII